jgi:hypothetical protein
VNSIDYRTICDKQVAFCEREANVCGEIVDAYGKVRAAYITAANVWREVKFQPTEENLRRVESARICIEDAKSAVRKLLRIPESKARNDPT